MAYDATGGTSSRATGSDTETRSLLQKAAAAVGAVFILVGILGFIPGITTSIYPMNLAGHGTENHLLLGLFEVSVLHNIVHLLFGVIGLAMAKTWSGAKNYLIGGGVVYLVLWIYGLVIDQSSAANFVPVNGADNWLHLVLGVGMIALGVILAKRDREAGVATTESR